jgi:hypothetical protein
MINLNFRSLSLWNQLLQGATCVPIKGVEDKLQIVLYCLLIKSKINSLSLFKWLQSSVSYDQPIFSIKASLTNSIKLQFSY